MERISRNELVTFRLKKASDALAILSGELTDLKKRLLLVETHNEELQDLIDKISESAQAISLSVGKSIEELESTDFIEDEEQSADIAQAEELSHGNADDVDFDF